MTTDNTPANVEPISEADLQTFAQKLQTWGEGLSDHERAVLQLLLSRSESAGEVQGYAYGMLFTAPVITAQLSPFIRGGLGAADGGSWLNLGWQKSGMPQINTFQQQI